MNVLRHKDFTNGSVYCLQLDDGMLIECTDTFLPIETKYCVGGDNTIKTSGIGDRSERFLIGISVGSGCPIGCKFCATGQMKGFRNLTEEEIIGQIDFVLSKNPTVDPTKSKEFKINWTRMSDSWLNLDVVRSAIEKITVRFPNVHHFVSTVGLRGSDFSWIKNNITLQISLHSLDESRRRELIPVETMSIEELGQIRTSSNLKTTVNLTLVDFADFDIDKLRKYFDPEYFFIKLSPVNPSPMTIANGIGNGIITGNTMG